MAVQTELGVVGKIRAELQKEQAEITIDAIHVKLIHHGGRSHQPRIRRSGVLTPPTLCPEHQRLLLRFPDKKLPFGLGKPAQMLGRNIVFPFPFAKRHDRNLFLSRERIHRCDEALADRVHQRTGHKLIAAMIAKEAGDAHLPLPLRHVYVQVHPVDPLDLKTHRIGQHFGPAPW